MCTVACCVHLCYDVFNLEIALYISIYRVDNIEVSYTLKDSSRPSVFPCIGPQHFFILIRGFYGYFSSDTLGKRDFDFAQHAQ